MSTGEDNPQTEKSAVAKTNSESDTGTESGVLWLVKNGPRWARIPAICITLLAALSSPVLLIRSQFFSSPAGQSPVGKNEPAASQLDMTTSGKVLNDEKGVEDSISNPKLTDEQRQKMQQVFSKVRHELQHLSNPKDAAVAWTIFAKQSPNDYFGYKIFPSDKCLLIARIEKGQGTSEWLPDPNRTVAALETLQDIPLTPRHFVKPQSQTPNVQVSEAPFDGNDGPLRLRPAVFNSLTDEQPGLAQLPPSIDKAPVQGTCLNPHPGPFSAVWGAYINQCQQPLYRRWNDGCAHVQMFDHCQNVWGPVVWQYCAANHHG